MLFLVESVILCILFTAMIKIATSKHNEAFANDYPPVVTDKLRKMGFIAEKLPAKKKDIIRKIVAMIFFSLLFSLLLRYVNGIESFAEGTITAYGLWLVVTWYDFFVMDVLLAPFDKFYKASEVSAFDKSAVWFHFKASLRGTVLGVGFAPVVGSLVALL